MTVGSDFYITETEREYCWPYPIPLEERPPPPPLVTKPKNFFVRKSKPCKCFAHQNQINPQFTYNDLVEKEKNLSVKLDDMRKEIKYLEEEIPKATKSKVITSYKIDFDRHKDDGDDELKDSNNFKTFAFGEFDSKFCEPVTMKESPKTVSEWFKTKTGRSEYQDTISKNGLSLMQNRQLYLQPLPSSKRKPADNIFY